ncbi:MAG: amidohydrolase [Actinobacteria bacterium]|nr:amidohydrolase [Actinomycetota bacterium]MBV8960171.1 amidohydrolase [Actinomycetota bacterium]MBV9253443.1 amidohydrolase [Actinomycetota bacterium]
MIWFPTPTEAPKYQMIQGALGQHGGDPSSSPTSYLFSNGPSLPEGRDPVDYTLEQMAKFNIGRAVVDVALDPAGAGAAQRHPDRFIASCSVDPNLGMEAVRQIERLHREFGIRAVSLAPAMMNPQVPIDDKRAYPVYAKCVELDLAVFITVGVPGPRVPMAAQRVELLDEVCWFFPELRIVMRHGAEPWDDLAVKLMLKWPNLYYSTSAFAPRRYPQSIIDYANTRGADKVMFAGYYAVGLTWDRIFTELDQLQLKDDVWPKFLRDNAYRVLGLAPASS